MKPHEAGQEGRLANCIFVAELSNTLQLVLGDQSETYLCPPSSEAFYIVFVAHESALCLFSDYIYSCFFFNTLSS